MGTPASIQIIHSGEIASMAQRSDGNPQWVIKNVAHWVITGGANKAHGLAFNVESLQFLHFKSYSTEVQKNVKGIDLFKDPEPNTETDTHTWNYVVDLDNKVITTFCNDSFLDDREENLPCDPLIYLKLIRDDCLEDVELEMRENMGKLIGSGFSFKTS